MYVQRYETAKIIRERAAGLGISLNGNLENHVRSLERSRMDEILFFAKSHPISFVKVAFTKFLRFKN